MPEQEFEVVIRAVVTAKNLGVASLRARTLVNPDKEDCVISIQVNLKDNKTVSILDMLSGKVSY